MNNLTMPSDTVLLGVDATQHSHNNNIANNSSNGLVQSGSGSPYLADEDAATCLLLPATPSPPPMDFIHPLQPAIKPAMNSDSVTDDNDDECCSSSLNNGAGGDDENDVGGGRNGGGGGVADDARGDTSSTSGSSGIGMDVPIAGTTTLYNNKNVYQNLDNNGETFQQNGTKQYANLNIQITKDTPGFVHWNWPLIRQCSFVAFMAGILAMVVVVVAMIVALPKRCDPKTSWYNGGVFYEIFPASYQDYNGDGVGDLLGLTTRVGYLKTLGITAVRLNSIFEAPHYPDNYHNVSSLFHIDAALGGQRELVILADALHARNMSLVLDLPLHPLLAQLDVVDERDEEADIEDVTNASSTAAVAGGNGDAMDDGAIAAARMRRSTAIGGNVVLQAMRLWLSLGVDGFYVKGLEHYHADPNLLANVQQWKRLLGDERVLIVSQLLVDRVAAAATAAAPDADGAAVEAEQLTTEQRLRDDLVRAVDLIDVTLDLTHDAEHIAGQILATVGPTGAFAAGQGRAQVHWSLGGDNEEPRRRIASERSPNATLAATMMALMLPGTPSILYGDEIGLRDAHDPHGIHADARRLHHLAPMAWSTEPQFTGRQTLPWLPAGAGAAQFGHADVVARLIELRRNSPTLYMNAIGKGKATAEAATNDGDKLSNTSVRTSRKDVLVVERWYPRRQSFVSITNVGAKRVRLDLSSLFYGGVVMAGVERGERVLFKDFEIDADQTVVVKLDK